MASQRVVTLEQICQEAQERGYITIERVLFAYRENPDAWVEAPTWDEARAMSRQYPWHASELYRIFRTERVRDKELEG